MLEYTASLLFVHDKDVIELPFKNISEIDRFKNIDLEYIRQLPLNEFISEMSTYFTNTELNNDIMNLFKKSVEEKAYIIADPRVTIKSSLSDIQLNTIDESMGIIRRAVDGLVRAFSDYDNMLLSNSSVIVNSIMIKYICKYANVIGDAGHILRNACVTEVPSNKEE